ncbi:hypothetical protein PIB30_056458 [Stylosanthes scabra]|uniref:Uncharacterized protein n=1 Tax=Stylosanthes scabra TaxID=79078 RepID=A0ABU6XHP2_9FABA|nr:hypothetical protein [Stylosanthes scabra]
MDQELINESIRLGVIAEGLPLQTKDDQNGPSHIPPPEMNGIRQGAMSRLKHPIHLSHDPDDMVEELAVRSCNGSSLDIGTLSKRHLASDSGVGTLLDGDTGCKNSDQASAKITCRSGFAECFIENTAKGKGIVCKESCSIGLTVESRDQNQMKAGIGTHIDSSVPLSPGSTTAKSPYNAPLPRLHVSECNGVSLREWLKSGRLNRSKAECLSIFRKIVDLVDGSHSEGFALRNLNPSYIKLLPSNQVIYLGLQKHMLDNGANSEVLQLRTSIRKRMSEQVTFPSHDAWLKKQKFNEYARVAGDRSQCLPRPDLYLHITMDSKVGAAGSQDYHNQYKCVQFPNHDIWKVPSVPDISNGGIQQLTSLNERSEDKWYTSPEGGCTTSANIYSLGVLFFELLSRFDSEGAHIAAMSDLHHRILPQAFLSESPMEAGFCLWLLHPEPSSRPTTGEILQSDVFNGIQEVYTEQLLLGFDKAEEQSELLLHFLILLKEEKQKNAFKLEEVTRFLESDIEEVVRRHSSGKYLVSTGLHNNMSCQNESSSLNKKASCSEPACPISKANQMKFIRNMFHLERAYVSMRSEIQIPETDDVIHPDKDIPIDRFVIPRGEDKDKTTDSLGAFFDGFCKDEEYFAAAGVSKKIKIYEFSSLFNDLAEIYYPVVEMSNESKFSCVCWNSYIRNYLASADYDGVVKLWDGITGQGFANFAEHEKRAWSVDFSLAYPTTLASASDDCSVKLWSINERNCIGTIQNVANVCCVQFSAYSSNLLAFGSANYLTYCYDLRNLRSPLCVLAGHHKAVSYVKFMDSVTLVSSSTDNTLKIWDLNKTSPTGPSTNACSLTLSGHTNQKNFVGLSVADGYIACGSENNEVYAYYKSLPKPITSHKFGSLNPINGKKTYDDYGHFVSSVCWKGKSDMVIAANSNGCWIQLDVEVKAFKFKPESQVWHLQKDLSQRLRHDGLGRSYYHYEQE